jgi:serine/threonine protein kinase/Flp pilus assembly protein TadD
MTSLDLPEAFHSTAEAFVRPALEDFRQHWNRPPREKMLIERYLTASGEVARSVLLYHLLCCELQLLDAEDTEPNREDYLARFSEHRSVVEAAFDALVTTQGISGALHSTQEPSVHASGKPLADSLPATEAYLAAAADSVPVGRVGDYEILDKLGSGGMGLVYRARQVSLNRPVALKMIRAGELADDSQIRRFRAEATAAAALDHPHIVPIYEIGEQNGQHYFSMALVDGCNLAQFAARDPLSDEAAARLIQHVARAVDYAHQHGVLHRDLKPANILVDNHGQPRVTDFGLAKRIEGPDGETATGQVLGTPSYMPPEQAIGQHDRVGPAADVYALGATLYFLLTGRPPFQGPNPVATLEQVKNQEPMPPRRINPWISRDLETICLKCLEKEPQRRYESAGALAGDLDRFLRREPIQARRASVWDKGLKWSRRRPMQAALTALLILLIGVSAVGFAWYHVNLQRSNADLHTALIAVRDQERIAREQRNLAQQNAELAEEQRNLALDTLYSMVFDFFESLGDTPATLRFKQQTLTRAIEGLREIPYGDDTLDRVQRTLAVAHSRLGDVVSRLGDSSAAREHFEQAMSILEERHRLHGDQPSTARDLAIAYERLGDLCLQQERNPAQAVQWFRHCLRLRERLVRDLPGSLDDRRSLSVIHEYLGDVWLTEGDLDAALQAYRQSLAIREVLAKETGSPESRRDLSVTYGKLGRICRHLRQFAEARQFLERALAIDEEALDKSPGPQTRRDVSATCLQFGELNQQLGDAAAALPYFKRALQLRESLAQEDPENAQAARDLATAYNRMGDVQRELARPQEAETMHAKALEIREKLAAADPDNLELLRDLTVSYERIGSAAQARGDLPTAREYFQRLLRARTELAQRNPGNDQTQNDLAIAHNFLAATCLQMGDTETARTHYQASLAICRSRAEGRETPQAWLSVVQNLIGIAGSYEQEGRLEPAREAFLEAQRIMQQTSLEAPPVAEHLRERLEALRQTADDAPPPESVD